MQEILINQARELIQKAKKIAIITHVSPDGDAMGSSLGLKLLLEKQGKEAAVLVPNDCPNFLKWLPQADTAIDFEQHAEKANAVLKAADLLFCLDFNDPSRAQGLADGIRNFGKPIICIDHHQQPSDFATVMISDVDACSTCQMIVEFAYGLGWKASLDADSATCLYTGIMTDTGSFKYYNTTALTHRLTADLIECGIDNTLIHQRIQDTNTFDKLQLVGYALSEKLTHLSEYKTCITGLTLAEMDRFNAQKGDTEGLVNMGLSVQGVVVSAFFKEAEDKIKISFRSKGNFSVNQFARDHFNGGGHTNAAGGMFLGTVEEAMDHFQSVLPAYKQQILSA